MSKLNPHQETLRTMKYKKITKDKKVQKESRERAVKFLAVLEKKVEEKQLADREAYNETMRVTRVD